MSVTVVIGAQWGDEAKGKLVDLLSEDADIVARFNGGDNAGHTVVNAFGTFKLRLIPNGFANPHTTCIIGPGVVVNLATLSEEVRSLQESGIDLAGRLWVSPRCHVVMPYHPLIEGIYEEAKGAARTGTTGRGMGPVFADKVSYNGIRLYDLADKAALAEKLHVQLAVKNPILAAFGRPPLDADQVLADLTRQYAGLRDLVHEPFRRVQEALAGDERIVLEGAQAALLDNDWGTYPFCTASTTLAGGAAAGMGIGPQWIDRTIGVAKAYTTRVGAGPMPTELLDETGELLRQAGGEFGTVTGRPRRCGWFDAAAVSFTAQLNAMTDIFLTKLDVLDRLPSIKVCIGYRRGTEGAVGAMERLYDYWDGDARWLEGCEPVYVEMDGWQQSTRGLRDFDRLPPQAQAYIRRLEELVGVTISMVSTGPEREATIQVP